MARSNIEWLRSQIEKKPPVFTTERGTLVLGAEDKFFEGEPVTIEYGMRPLSILALGAKGSGKTNIITLLANQLEAQGWPLLFIDLKNEFASQASPNTKTDLYPRLYKYGLAPRGMNVLPITPIQCADVDALDAATLGMLYYLELLDFKEITDSSIRENMLTDLLYIEKGAPETLLMDWSDRLPDTYEEWAAAIASEVGFTKSGEAKKTGSGLIARLKSLSHKIESFRRAAKEQGIQMERTSIPMLMGAGFSPVLQLSLNAADNPLLSLYVKKALIDITKDRTRAKKGVEPSYLKTPVGVVIDEADILAPSGKNPPAKDNIRWLDSKNRAIDVFTLKATQEPLKLDSTLVTQADKIVISRPRSPDDLKVLLSRGIPRSTVEHLATTLDATETPQQWALIDENGDVRFFYPLPCPGEPMREEHAKW